MPSYWFSSHNKFFFIAFSNFICRCGFLLRHGHAGNGQKCIWLATRPPTKSWCVLICSLMFFTFSPSLSLSLCRKQTFSRSRIFAKVLSINCCVHQLLRENRKQKYSSNKTERFLHISIVFHILSVLHRSKFVILFFLHCKVEQGERIVSILSFGKMLCQSSPIFFAAQKTRHSAHFIGMRHT